jgi:uncharacterized protein YuzB (UPF0349 family)
MLIKFSCKKHCADFTKDEMEIIYQRQSFTHCAFCGEKLYISNLVEIVKRDLEERTKNNIDKWFSEIGVDNTLDLIQRNKNQSCYRLYKEELERRGFNVR